MAPAITCTCGSCEKCRRRTYMRDYYARNAERCRQTARLSRERNIEVVRERDRARGYREYDSQKARARRLVRDALARGDLERQPCEVCGVTPSDAHHDDYSKPLVVRWLCEPHHGAVHRRIAA